MAPKDDAEAEKLARLRSLREEAAALETELGLAPPTFGFTREEAFNNALPPGEPPFWRLPEGERDEPAPIDCPLKGVVVLDLTRILAGPHCAKMVWAQPHPSPPLTTPPRQLHPGASRPGPSQLVDLGARVIAIEHPQADIGATGGTRPSLEYFASTHAGKESVVLDLQRAEGKARLHELCATADVIIEKYPQKPRPAPAAHARRCPCTHSSRAAAKPQPLVAQRAPARTMSHLRALQ